MVGIVVGDVTKYWPVKTYSGWRRKGRLVWGLPWIAHWHAWWSEVYRRWYPQKAISMGIKWSASGRVFPALHVQTISYIYIYFSLGRTETRADVCRCSGTSIRGLRSRILGYAEAVGPKCMGNWRFLLRGHLQGLSSWAWEHADAPHHVYTFCLFIPVPF